MQSARPWQARRTTLLLAGCVGLMATGYGVILPIFARRMGGMGGSVRELGLMAMTFAVAHVLLSPLLGTLSDRRGRRPFILLGLGGFAFTSPLYALATTPAELIAIRAGTGVLTAGLYPAAMGLVADVAAPEDRTARMGTVMAGYAVGLALGPLAGGVLYDAWGGATPFVVSAVLGVLALLAVLVWVPETRRERPIEARPTAASRPHAVSEPLVALLGIELMLTLALTFAEPQLVVHVYDALGWTSLQLGALLGCYAAALACAQGMLSRSSDRYGRLRVIYVGLLLTSCLYFGLAAFSSFGALLVFAAGAGLGTGLIEPALGAMLIDQGGPGRRGRVMGWKNTATGAGTVLGPLGIAILGGQYPPRVLFFFVGAGVLVLTLVMMTTLREPERAPPARPTTGE